MSQPTPEEIRAGLDRAAKQDANAAIHNENSYTARLAAEHAANAADNTPTANGWTPAEIREAARRSSGENQHTRMAAAYDAAQRALNGR